MTLKSQNTLNHKVTILSQNDLIPQSDFRSQYDLEVTIMSQNDFIPQSDYRSQYD